MKQYNTTLHELNDMYPVFLKQVINEFGEPKTEDEKKLHIKLIQEKLKQYINKKHKGK